MNKQLKQKMIAYAKANYVNVTLTNKCRTWDDGFTKLGEQLILWFNCDKDGAIGTTAIVTADMVN